jgi:hypothetical protein
MMNLAQPVNLDEASEHVAGLLAEVPFLEVGQPEKDVNLPTTGGRADLLFKVSADGRAHTLVCELKRQAQPRSVREAAAQLRYYCDQIGGNAYGVLLAPYLSPASQQICKEHRIGFADFQGNCYLAFDGVFIQRLVAGAPPAERRELRSIFAPKSAQVLRELLRDPARRWKVKDLAHVAGVSLGHVSNVRTGLLDREWAEAGALGLRLTAPDALLDTWRSAYRAPGRRHAFYTPLHGKRLQEAIRDALAPHERGQVILGGFSAAQWLAPYARATTEFFYADRDGVQALQPALDLSSAAKGENVVVMELGDEDLFRDAVEPAPGIRCTGAAQTYLDLWISGERGREAAEHLRTEKLQWNPSS